MVFTHFCLPNASLENAFVWWNLIHTSGLRSKGEGKYLCGFLFDLFFFKLLWYMGETLEARED